MPELQAFPLVTRGGLKGKVFRASRFLDRSNVNRVQLDDGTERSVLASELHVQPDGTFLLDDAALGLEPAAAPNATSGPEPGEPVYVGERRADAGEPEPAVSAPAPSRWSEPAAMETAAAAAPARETILDEPLFVEDVQVERVPINRILEGPAQTRQEGDTTIVPVVEEVITVQKRLLLKEEVRITRRRTEVRQPRTVRLDVGETRILGSDGREIEQR